MSRRTYSRNAFETELTSGVDATTTTIVVTSAAGLTAPSYQALDPEDPGVREYIKITNINVNTLTVERALIGSVDPGGSPHVAGAKMRAVAVSQWLDDIFDDIEDLEQWDTDHITAPDPHPQYLTPAEGDAAYVNTSGDSMDAAAQIKVDTNPVVDDDLSRKGYVDQEDAATLAAAQAYADTGDSDHVSAGDPHAQYLLKTGDAMEGILDMAGNFLTNPNPPVNGDQVGDRGYNDNRYLQLSAGGLVAGPTQFTSDLTVVKVLFGDGANGSPTLTFTSDTNLGFYRRSADLIGVSGEMQLGDPVNDGVLRVKNIAVGAAPAGPITGDLWVDTFDDALKRYSGGSWQTILQGGGVEAGVGSGTPSALTGTMATKGGINVAMPTGWGSAKVVARAAIFYAGVVTGDMQISGRLQIDGDNGPQFTGNFATADNGEDLFTEMVHEFPTSQATIDIDVQALDGQNVGGSATPRWYNIDYTLIRTS